MSEHNSSSKQSWWHTLPGMLTGLAAVTGAVTGLVVGLHQIGVFTNEAENDRQRTGNGKSGGRSSEQGFRVVETIWRLGGSGMTLSGWKAINIYDPHDIESSKAHFEINCR